MRQGRPRNDPATGKRSRDRRCATGCVPVILVYLQAVGSLNAKRSIASCGKMRDLTAREAAIGVDPHSSPAAPAADSTPGQAMRLTLDAGTGNAFDTRRRDRQCV